MVSSRVSLARRILNAIWRRVRHAWVLISARKASLKRAREVAAGRVLVLCYGNIYRSPFVERKLAKALSPERWTVRSAGFHDRAGRSCAPEYVALARQYGVSLSDHRSRRVTERDVEEAELVIIMDRKNWDQLHALATDAEHKVVWIGCALPRGGLEVQDPYGRSAEETNDILRRLNQAVDAIVQLLH